MPRSLFGGDAVGVMVHSDLFHTFASFVGPLPAQSMEWKTELLSRFPVILDTKQIARYS